MSEITDFYLSWLGNSAFGNTPSGPGIQQKPIPPKPPVVVPDPIASFDFNKYIAGDSTIVNDVSGGASATINEPLANTFVSDISNSYLSIYAPNNFPDPTGGILLPNLSNVTAIELWMQYTSLGNYGQFFLDAREGSTDSYYVVSDTGVDASGAWVGGTIYYNTQSQSITSTSPNVAVDICGNGWTQVVVVASGTISDDIAVFMRNNGVQGMPVDIAEVLVYDATLTEEIVVELFNARCSRYGLSPIVFAVP